MFVGPLPFGTRIKASPDEQLCAGIYWHEDWGADDFDLSAITPKERIAWNGKWSGSLQYSGDITNAPDGAMEFIKITNDLNEPVILLNNLFTGNSNSRYQIAIGNSKDTILNFFK